MSESSKYNIHIKNIESAQIGDNTVTKINRTIIYNIDVQKLKSLVLAARQEICSADINDEDKSVLNDNLDVIENEPQQANPRKGFIKIALAGLKAAKETFEFGAALTALIQFVQQFI